MSDTDMSVTWYLCFSHSLHQYFVTLRLVIPCDPVTLSTETTSKNYEKIQLLVSLIWFVRFSQTVHFYSPDVDL